MQIEKAIQLAKSSRWLSQFDQNTRGRITSQLRLINLTANQTLFDFDQEATDLYFLATGSLVVEVPHPVTGTIHGHVMLPGRWFGEPAALGRRRRLMSVKARRTAHLLALSSRSVADLIRQDHAFAWSFFNLMALNLEEHLLHAVDLLISDPRLRLFSRLLTLAGRVRDQLPPSPVDIPLTQEELGLASNMSRSSVFQFLGELADKGICEVGYGKLTLLDVDGLAEIISPGDFQSPGRSKAVKSS